LQGFRVRLDVGVPTRNRAREPHGRRGDGQGTDPAGWYDLVFPSALALQPGTYWIGVISGGSSNVAGFRWNSVSGARALNQDNYGDGPSNPFGTASFDSEQMSVYATYTAG
jgi:hypothetical protein